MTWAIVEIFGGLPEGVWIEETEAEARTRAEELANNLGYEPAEDGGDYWVRGDSELHIREVES